MKKINDHQIADLLHVAADRLAYSRFISAYPATQGKRNFDTTSEVDAFYKNVCTTSFHDALLITATMIDKRNKKGISFWNWSDFREKKGDELAEIAEEFKASGLKGARDQVVGHADVDNHNNDFPHTRRQGIIDERLIEKLQSIQNKLIALFFDYTNKAGTPYSPSYFDVTRATNEPRLVMAAAKPKLTDGFVI